MLAKPVLPFLEIMITQACNISCLGCTNYSDLKHSGYLTWDEGRQQIEPWLNRIDIPDFGIMGGEPLINPDVRAWIQGCRDLMPDTQIRFTTNGLLMGRNLDILDLLADIGNCVFKITVHVNSKELDDLVEYVHKTYDWETVIEYGITRFKTKNNFRFQINRPSIFTKTYRNTYSDMRPYNSNPAAAIANCCQAKCPLLYQGRLYKCSTSGLLQEVLDRFDRPNYEEWQPYIVQGLDPDCTEQELKSFIANFGRAHAICRQCPSGDQGAIIHLENVKKKND